MAEDRKRYVSEVIHQETDISIWVYKEGRLTKIGIIEFRA